MLKDSADSWPIAASITWLRETHVLPPKANDMIRYLVQGQTSDDVSMRTTHMYQPRTIVKTKKSRRNSRKNENPTIVVKRKKRETAKQI